MNRTRQRLKARVMAAIDAVELAAGDAKAVKAAIADILKVHNKHGRPTIGTKAMTSAERSRRHRAKKEQQK